MKIFERIVCNHLSRVVSLDPFQFAYRENRSVENAVSLCIHSVLQHLESPGNYAKIIFRNYSSAFNTILPTVNYISTSAYPPYCTHYTPMIVHHIETDKMYTFADDRTLLGLISKEDDDVAYRN